MPRKPRILIIDCDPAMHERWVTELITRFHVTSALSIEDAQYIIETEPVFTAIAIDTFLNHNTPLAIPLIHHLRNVRGFKRPIIGIAEEYDEQIWMVQAGCSSFATHTNLPDKIMESLRLNTWSV